MGRNKREGAVAKHQRLKPMADSLATALELAGYPKAAETVAACQRRIDTAIVADDTTAHEIIVARYGCKHPLCPTCGVARARKTIAILAPLIADLLNQYPQAHWGLWTLTPGGGTITPAAAPATITQLTRGWTQLLRNAAYRRAVLGALRALEVTRNSETGGLHPHLHCLVLLHPHYFNRASRYYISADQLRADWSRKLRRPVSQIDMTPIASGDGSPSAIFAALVECTWYTTKPADLFSREDQGWHCDPAAVAALCPAIKGRRKLSLSGAFYQARQARKRTPAEADFPDFENEFHDPQMLPVITELTRVWSERLTAYREADPFPAMSRSL